MSSGSSSGNAGRYAMVSLVSFVLLGAIACWIANPIAHYAQAAARQRWGSAQTGFIDEVLPGHYADENVDRICYAVTAQANACVGRVMKNSYRLHDPVTYWQDKAGHLFVRNSLNESGNRRWYSAPWPWTQKFYLGAGVIAFILSLLYAELHIRYVAPSRPDDSLEVIPLFDKQTTPKP